ncbi:homeobox-leucine zipper protein HOX11-like [Forsythia ovata]|uniref:Homeobox-leucine zipper protein HOX11-like n=1 Tax=Forsythia ovata TaxID=205694 RepID=A0ABD1VHC6_9LAMI
MGFAICFKHTNLASIYKIGIGNSGLFDIGIILWEGRCIIPVIHERQQAIPPLPPCSSENGSSRHLGLLQLARGFEVKGPTVVAGGAAEEEVLSEAERASSRASDEDENSHNSRKKLRLSKEQSAYLEENFKEHSTLNPCLDKLRSGFRTGRARTKLKQTEVDCEYLKRFCDSLTEENRRLNKELQELKALNSSNPFCMQLPATTLTMCPSCERVATTTSPATPTSTPLHSHRPSRQSPHC